jgi:hypothetical protein
MQRVTDTEVREIQFTPQQLNTQRQDTGTHGEDTEGDEDKERQKDVAEWNKQKVKKYREPEKLQ